MPSAHSFVRHLAIAYIVLLVYACLHPLKGWQAIGLPMFDYLFAPWPKYFNKGDFFINIVGYIPLGLILVPALSPRWSARRRIAVAVVFAISLSFCLETLQGFLPTRISSNIDLATNSLGALIGALAGARWGRALFSPGRGLARLRERYIVGGLTGDVALVLIVLWLFAQLIPDPMLFTGGELRKLFGVAPPLPFKAGNLIAFEAAQTACMLVALGLFARCTLRVPGAVLVAVLLTIAIGARIVASTYLFNPPSPMAWVTPGAKYGLLVGSILLLIALRLPRVAQHALAGTGLLIATILINMMPESPYFLNGVNASSTIVPNANYPNFYGLCRLISALWPFAALAYLSIIGLWRGEHLEDRPSAETL